MRKILFACAIGLIFLSIGFAAFHQPSWDAPPEAKQKKNPVAPTVAAMREAKSIFADKCANCHGDTGKGDGSDAMMYDPGPADLTDAKRIGKFTDGELFYKLTVGKKPMPSFKKRLSEEQRWELVLFVRSLSGSNDANKISNPEPPKSAAPTHP